MHTHTHVYTYKHEAYNICNTVNFNGHCIQYIYCTFQDSIITVEVELKRFIALNQVNGIINMIKQRREVTMHNITKLPNYTK